MRPRTCVLGLPILLLPILALGALVALATLAAGATSVKGEKIPLTTKSEKARQYFLAGLDLVDRLRSQESVEYFQKAVAEDPDFAMAYLNLALVAPSTEGFFGNLEKAKALRDRVSKAERLCIEAVDADVVGLPLKARDCYKKLVAAYPDDERAHTLLGNNYFALQDYFLAIEEYLKATKIAPSFSPPYNQLGYSRRYLGDYAGAEKAFKQYIKLIPDDPNPYDSYAELLMKMGKYDESIESYRKALALNPSFLASHIGIASDLNFKGEYEAARAELDNIFAIARNDGERRAVHFAKAVSYVYQGDLAGAMAEIEKRYALAEKINDIGAMAGDLGVIGDVLCESGKYDEAMSKYQQGVELVKNSDLAPQVKDNTDLSLLYNSGYVAARKGDLAEARVKARAYLKGTEALDSPNLIRLAHQLAGVIALAAGDYDKALEEFRQASQQNPYTLYRIALAYKGKGDTAKAKEFAKQAVSYNGLNNMAQAYVMDRARKLLASL
jgi:tetratricopeptide (TPR) repeat protein